VLDVALCQLFNEAGKPENRTVRTTYAELAKIMQRPRGGSWYEAIPASLNRLMMAMIYAVQTWPPFSPPVEAPAQVLDPGVEAMLAKHLLEMIVEGVAWRMDDRTARDPQIRLPLLLVACSHGHGGIPLSGARGWPILICGEEPLPFLECNGYTQAPTFTTGC
jgi:hypothetical protein